MFDAIAQGATPAILYLWMELQTSIIVVVAAVSTGIYATRVVMSQETDCALRSQTCSSQKQDWQVYVFYCEDKKDGRPEVRRSER